jgi:glucuronoarabinoxylan endo-1,4-beta-xylanase
MRLHRRLALGFWLTIAACGEAPNEGEYAPLDFELATGTGLTGQYFNNQDFTGTTQTRVDPNVNFEWGTAAPVSGFGVDTFSVRWTGEVETQFGGTYTFYTTSDDGIRLWVNGQQIINNWTNHGPTENSGTITLAAGQRYSLQLEYYEAGQGATAKLSWSHASQAKQIIPQARLYPTSSTRVCTSAAENASATLACPAGQSISSIGFASYGTPTGACGSYATSACNASNSMSIVSNACLGRTSCTVAANNATFGDPCLNTVKRLNVQVHCSAAGSGGTGGTGGSGGTGGTAGTGGTGGSSGTGGTSGTSGSGGWGATPNVTIDRATQYQTIEGFGFFGAQNTWWSSAGSLWSDAWGTQVLTDLGATLWRNEYYSEEANQDANWAKQLPVVQGLKRIADANRVPLKFVSTVWSTPSSMKCTVASVQANQNPCTRHPDGLKNGGTLDPSKYAAYAQWLVDGINKYSAAGVSLYALSPQNEPMFVQSYNSAVYDIDPAKRNSYSRMIEAVAPLVKQAFPNVRIFGTENMLELEGQQWFYSPKFTSTTWSKFDALAYHGYVNGVVPTPSSQLAQYWNFVRTSWAEPNNKPSWMTETSGYVDAWTGDGEFPGARDLALAIYSALAHGRVSAWIWWQGSEQTSSPGPYTLMGGTQTKRSRYYVSKNFYRYIRPGARMLRVTTTDPNLFVVAFAHPTMGAFTVVAINTSNTNKSLVLGGANVPTSFSAYRTSATENTVSLGTVSAPSITLRADSVTTLVNGNVFE